MCRMEFPLKQLGAVNTCVWCWFHPLSENAQHQNFIWANTRSKVGYMTHHCCNLLFWLKDEHFFFMSKQILKWLSFIQTWFPACAHPAEGEIPTLEGNQSSGTLFNKLIFTA